MYQHRGDEEGGGGGGLSDLVPCRGIKGEMAKRGGAAAVWKRSGVISCCAR